MVFRRKNRIPAQTTAPFDPNTVGAAYRAPVVDALRVRDQYAQLVASVQAGPLRDRLTELTARVDAGVDGVRETAVRATELERVVATLDPDRVTAELKHARRAGVDEDVISALNARFASTQRLLNHLESLRNKLPVLEARLGAAVAQAADLAFSSSTSGLVQLETELERVVVELDALGRASAELS